MDLSPETRMSLTSADLQKLLANTSADARVKTILKISTLYSKSDFLEKEKRIAEQIFRLIAKDVEEQVRITLSWNLATAEHLPSDIALTLANDHSDIVANPLLQFSNLLTSSELIKIVEEGNESRQVAIASRLNVKEGVASALSVHGKEDAVKALMKNESAVLKEDDFQTVADRFSNNEDVQKSLIMRENIPQSVAERLLNKVSENLKKHIIEKYNIDPQKAHKLLERSCERATVTVTNTLSDKEAQAFIVGLQRSDRLTPSIVVRSLCTGDTVFFENAIAFLTELPTENIRALVYDQGSLGFPALYKKAKLPERLFPAARTAVDLIKRFQPTKNIKTKETFSRLVARRLAKLLEQNHQNADIDVLLDILNTSKKTVE